MLSSLTILGLTLTAFLPVSNAYFIQWRQNITQELQSHLSPGAEIYFPSDPDYANETTQRWTVYEEPTYVAAVKPVTDHDVQATVKIAAHYGVPFLATGGGHGLSITLNKLQNGISIDLGNFKKVTVDAAANTVTVGGANVFADVFDPVWDAGKEMTVGSCACPGIVGATVGGGVGRFQGLHGLILDNLVSAVVVTADGRLLTVSETENSELFWGIRGAGASFGIILWATYKIHDHTNGGYALNADFIFPANASIEFWNILEKFSENLPAELTLITDVNYNANYGGINILFNAVYLGPEAEGRAMIQPFIDNNPLVTNITYVEAKTLVDVAMFGLFADAQCAKGRHVNTYTVGTKGLDVSTFQTHFQNLSQFYTDFPQAQASTFFIETFPNQAILAQPKNSTSVPHAHREIRNYVLWGYNYEDMSIDDQVNTFAQNARAAFASTSGFGDLELYVTYSHGDEGPEVWYREQLPGLTALKEEWDPQVLFRYMNPVVV